MPKQLQVVAITLGLVLIAGFGYLMVQSETEEPSTSVTNQQTTESQTETIKTTQSGSYKDYDAQTVAATEGKRILFFHAPWCPQCRELDASITAGTIPAGVTIFKVDYDSNQKLRQQYGVTIQTTLVLLDETGGETKKYVAYEKPNLDALIKNLL